MPRLPRVLAEIIADYAIIPMLLPWVPKNVLTESQIYRNPNAYLAGVLDMNIGRRTICELEYLAMNPVAGDYILANFGHFRLDNYPELWTNPNPMVLERVMEFAASRNIKINTRYLAENTNPRAIELLKRVANFDDDDVLIAISVNPEMISWLRANPDKIDRMTICANPAAIDIIHQSLHGMNPFWLAANPHPWAVEQMRVIYSEPNHLRADHALAENPAIFEFRRDPAVLAALMAA